jgi:multicomponent Na+:H+ antiporter subunit F
MYAAAMLGILVTMGLALARATLGPTIVDRILAVNMFGTKTVLLISVMSLLTGRSDYLDLALVYALINFIGVIAVLKFSTHGGLRDRKVINGEWEARP